MISITCTNCESVLTIDDAFAGGVCRCQFCGTIQTVPSKKEQAALTAKATAKSLYQKEKVPPRSEASGTGLEHLGGGISGSGLVETQAALRQHVDDPAAATPVPTAPLIQPAPSAQGTRVSVVLITAAVVVVTGIAVAILLSRMTDRGHASQTNPNALALSGPNFCGIPVTGSSVIYLIDRGNSINEFFDAVKAATYKSLKQLGPDRKFQVILWDNDAGSTEFPSGAMRNATAGAVEDCQRSFQDLTAGGSSHLAGPLREALARKPQFIVIATAKSQLEDDDTDALHSALGSGTHLCFLQIGPNLPPLFEDLAKSTGGQAKHLTPEELREFSK
jgi:hypothetical protein